MNILLNKLNCLYYNFLSQFFIILNIFFPYYNKEILQIQCKIMSLITNDMISSNKNIFSLINGLFNNTTTTKNNDLIELSDNDESTDNEDNVQDYLENIEEVSDDNSDDNITEEDTDDNSDDELNDIKSIEEILKEIENDNKDVEVINSSDEDIDNKEEDIDSSNTIQNIFEKKMN